MGHAQDLSRFGIANRTYSIEEWLAIEDRTGERFEFHEGRLVSVTAMAGGTPTHALLTGNVTGSLFKAFTTDEEQFARCHTYSSDLRLQIPGTRRYLYPDAAVVCGAPEYDTRVPTAVRNPVVVVEVLSPSSAGYDLGEKFEYYERLASLREYVLVSQEEYRVEVRTREEAGGSWRFAFYSRVDGEAVALPSLGIALPMRELYRGVDLEVSPDETEQEELVPA